MMSIPSSQADNYTMEYFQTVPESRQVQKLSKPRTNTSSSDLLSIANRQGEPVASLAQAGKRRCRRNSRPKNQVQDDRSSDSVPQVDSVIRRKSVSNVARDMRDRLSRTASVVSQIPSARASSTNLNVSTSSLVSGSTMPNFEDTARVWEEIKEKALLDRQAAEDHAYQPLEENDPSAVTASPIRRRSLFTPGLATRDPTDILCKPPPLNQIQTPVDRDYYYNPNLSESSPLSRLAALDRVEEVQISAGPRPCTPADYDCLGGLELGTLRVMNNTPVSSNRHQLNIVGRSSCDMISRDKRSLATEHILQETENMHPKLQDLQHPGVFRNPSIDAPIDSDCIGEQLNDITEPELHSQHKGGVREPYLQNEGISTFDNAQEGLRRNSLSFRRQSLEVSQDSCLSSDRAFIMAQDYIMELPDSPYSHSKVAKEGFPDCEVASAGIREYDLRAEDNVVIDSFPQPIFEKWNAFLDDTEARHAKNGSRKDAFDILDRPSVVSDEPASTTFNPFPASKDAGVNWSPHDSNLDSGYSSNGSMQSSENEICPSAEESVARSRRKSFHRVSRILSGPREMLRSSTSNSPTGNMTQDKSKLETPKARPISMLSRLNPSSPSIKRSAQPLEKESTLQRTTMDASGVSASPATSRTRKLHKSRPLSMPAQSLSITVQGCRDLNDTLVPPIPSDSIDKLAERLQNFPLLDHTFPNPQHTQCAEINTSSSPPVLPVRFPSPENPPTTTFSLMKSISRKARRKSNASSHNNSHSGDRFESNRRPSQHYNPSYYYNPSQRETFDSIADFGDVAEYLGKSPYDIARSALEPKQISSTENLSAFPPRMATKKPRAKTMVGMDASSAADLARMRSKYRTKSMSRPKNMCLDDLSDDGRIVGKLFRPRCQTSGAPPVPALPLVQQTEQKEAQAFQSSSDHLKILDRSYDMKRIFYLSKKDIQDQSVGNSIKGDSTVSMLNYEHDHAKPSPSSHKKPLEQVTSDNAGLFEPSHSILSGEWLNSRPGTPLSHFVSGHSPAASSRPDTFKQTCRSSVEMTSISPTTSTTSFQGGFQNLSSSSLSMNTAMASSERLAGRYDGGLYFGYEPGFGLGGSAGTRSAKSGATRKSVNFSLGFGVDLSDIPIFVAPSA